MIDETRAPTLKEWADRRRSSRPGPWSNPWPRRWLPSSRAVLELELELGERAADALIFTPFEGFHGAEGPMSVILHARIGAELPHRASREDRRFFRELVERLGRGELAP